MHVPWYSYCIVLGKLLAAQAPKIEGRRLHMHLLIQLTSNFHERRYYKVGRTVGGVTSIEGKQVNSSMPDIVICIYVRPFIGATEEVLEWFKYPCTSAHPRCKVSCQEVPNQLTLSLCLCFVEASPKVEKAVSCYKAD